MDFASIGVASVAVITVICYLVGMIVKACGFDTKWIPIVVGVCGACLGVAGMYLMNDFPAQDYITAVSVGIVSGLAATGVDQIGKQLGK